MPPSVIPSRVDDRPVLCGHESTVAEAMARPGPIHPPAGDIDFDRIGSAFAVALHMHQPLIPAGGHDLSTARIVSNLQYMLSDPGSGDHYNATIFRWCYKRMGEFIPALLADGARPRVMLDYSGCLLWGLQALGADDVLDSLGTLANEPGHRNCVEWLGTAWGHPVAPSTPVQDYRLHVRAWQHHFAGLFGLDALARVRGFSPCEMALPNHPDVAFEFVKTLTDCGYRWLLVQEHTVELADGGGHVRRPHLPHRLLARNSRGQTASIIAVIKTQGSDTKLVGQMQPYYEARGLARTELAGRSVPPLVTQIADGENGGVMMNEFPPKYNEVMRQAGGGDTAAVNVTEYLEYLERIGIAEADLPAVQPIMQKRIWDRFPDGAGPEAMDKLVQTLEREDHRFHMEGGSWTNNLSWVRGYEGLLGPMEAVSAAFAEKVIRRGGPPTEPRFGQALFLLLLTQTSCFRYWGHGRWTDYGRELCRRCMSVIELEF